MAATGTGIAGTHAVSAITHTYGSLGGASSDKNAHSTPNGQAMGALAFMATSSPMEFAKQLIKLPIAHPTLSSTGLIANAILASSLSTVTANAKDVPPTPTGQGNFVAPLTHARTDGNGTRTRIVAAIRTMAARIMKNGTGQAVDVSKASSSLTTLVCNVLMALFSMASNALKGYLLSALTLTRISMAIVAYVCPATGSWQVAV